VKKENASKLWKIISAIKKILLFITSKNKN